MQALATRLNTGPRAIQLKAIGGQLGRRGSGGRTAALPLQLKHGVEQLSGVAMDGVTVHYDSPRPVQLQAHAYAQGTHIHLAPGQERHLPHEAWHVAQQAQGRVASTGILAGGVAVNGDRGLEHEADVMGARAAVVAMPAPRVAMAGERVGMAMPAQRAAIAPRADGVAQLAAPGGIEHAEASCFAAALINTFTVVAPLRNLLIPSNNPVAAGAVQVLQQVLWQAVNTVDAGVIVPQAWMERIMAALRSNAIIVDATATADFSEVMSNVVERLTAGGAASGQANGQPVSTGEVAWFREMTLQDSVMQSVTQMRIAAGNLALAPNSLHVTRNAGTTGIAPQFFDLPGAAGPTTYRLRSVVNVTDAFVGGHFTTHVDRGAAAPEWHHSDDLAPHGVAAVPDLGATTAPRQGRAYVYERLGSVVAPDAVAAPVTAGLGDVAAGVLNGIYREDLAKLRARETSASQQSTSSGQDDTSPFAAFAKKGHEAEKALSASIAAFRLPAIEANPANIAEYRRQLGLQLTSLNRLTVIEWAFQVMLNRMKSADQLVEGYSTPGGTRLKARVDAVLRGNTLLANQLLMQIDQRMTELIRILDPSDRDTIATAQRVITLAQEAQGGEPAWDYFDGHGGLALLARLSHLSIKGGIGRQHGEGDNTWFRRVHGEGVMLHEEGRTETQAVLHNPDQVAGGQMEIMHGKAEVALLEQGRRNYVAARERNVAAQQIGGLAAQRAAAVLASAGQVYRDLIARYMGDSGVNSKLGQAWIEDLGGGGSRIEHLLDHVMTIPLERWENTHMNVRMDVNSSDKTRSASRLRNPARIKKDREKQLRWQNKGKRKGGRGRAATPKDVKLSKTAGKPRQLTLHNSLFRSKAPKRRPAIDTSGKLNLSMRAALYGMYHDYLAEREAENGVDEALARRSFDRGATDEDRYLWYLNTQEAEAQAERQAREENAMGESDDEENEIHFMDFE